MFEKIKETIVGIFNSKNAPEQFENQNNSSIESIQNPVFIDEVVAFVKDEFEKRSEDRIPFELQWRLNQNFLLGQQYCKIVPVMNDIVETEKAFWWEEREVFNNIAPIVETRLAKLNKLKPSMAIRPATSELNDISTAKVCKNILLSAQQKTKLMEKINTANAWAEICGCVFHKNVWDNQKGALIGYFGDDNSPIYEGDLNFSVVPAYEIYPDSNYHDGPENCRSIIHAKAYDVDTVKDLWDVELEGEEIDVFSLSNTPVSVGGLGYNATVPEIASTVVKNSVLVLEYQELPSKKYPEGRLAIVAKDKLLHYGPLPYQNGENKKRTFSIIRQNCIYNPGCFWGISVIERLIPIQRAYNAVKNRIHDYLNRVALNAYDYEEGSLTDDELTSLEEDGIAPGSVIPRKPGTNPIHTIDAGQLPTQFDAEVANLEKEFIEISGVSEISRNSSAPTGVSSGTALEILNDQDDTRIALTAENIKEAIKKDAQQWLRLYKQFAGVYRVDRIAGENNDVLVQQWESSQITSDDVFFDTEDDLIQTPAQRKQFVMDLQNMGLLVDPDTGKISKSMRSKILEMLNLGNWESADSIEQLHKNRADKENTELQKDGTYPQIKRIDDDDIHMQEHLEFMLSNDFEDLEKNRPDLAQKMMDHYGEHEKSKMIKLSQQVQASQMIQMPAQQQQQ